MIETLKKSANPDLKIISQQTHPQSSDLLVMNAAFTGNALPYKAFIWCMTNAKNGISVFATFYAPQKRFASLQMAKILIQSGKAVWTAIKFLMCTLSL
jgi:hypothetical protein